MCQDILISVLWEVNPALLIAVITADSAPILNLFGATSDVISQINVGFWRSGTGPDATFATHRCVLDSGAVISAASKSFYNENIKDKPCEMRALQNISGRHLRDASGGQMRVLGVCDVKMHLHRDLASSVKLLIFEHLAADLIIGRKQMQKWNAALIYRDDAPRGKKSRKW